MSKTIVYPGTFDPLTNGHLELIQRASSLFDQVIVAIAANPHKKPMFSLEQRIQLVQAATASWQTISVIGFDSLLVDLVKQHQTNIVLRGLRAISDFEYEIQLASMNRALACDFETVFLTPSLENSFISSKLVKEIASLGGNIKSFVPDVVYQALTAWAKNIG